MRSGCRTEFQRLIDGSACRRALEVGTSLKVTMNCSSFRVKPGAPDCSALCALRVTAICGTLSGFLVVKLPEASSTGLSQSQHCVEVPAPRQI